MYFLGYEIKSTFHNKSVTKKKLHQPHITLMFITIDFVAFKYILIFTSLNTFSLLSRFAGKKKIC